MEDLAEINNLAGLFQNIVKDCKVSFPLFETLMTKSNALQCQILSTVSCLSSFLDSLQMIADTASNSKGSSRDIGTFLTRMILRHREVVRVVNTLARTLHNSVTLCLQDNIEIWKKSVTGLERRHNKQFKSLRSGLQKKSETLVKVDKKLNKNKSGGEKRQQIVEMKTILEQDLRQQTARVVQQERKTLKEVVQKERDLFSLLAGGLTPVVLQEVSLIREVEQMEEVVERMNRVIFDSKKTEDEYEHVLNSRQEQFSFITPPSTPGSSLMGSRSGSIRSLNSFSRPSSVASDVESCGRSRNNSVSSYQSSHQDKRNSRESRHSGFSSQEILLLKQQESLKQVYSNVHRSPDCKNHIYMNSPGKTPAARRTASPSPYANVVTRRPPLPPKYRPVVPERKSSLDRCSVVNGPGPGSNVNNNFPAQTEDRTPTNDNILLLDPLQASLDNWDYSSFSSHSSGYGSVNNGEPGPGSPDCDGDKTLRRHPRKRDQGAVRSPPAPEETDDTPGDDSSPASHAAYIRTLTERLSYDF